MIHAGAVKASSLRGMALVVQAVLLCAVASVPVHAADEPSGPMIPPGQEEVLAEMLGRAVVLAGCELTGASVEYTYIKATYACPEGEVVFELSHPSVAPTTAIETRQFAMVQKSGHPPHSLVDALVSRIRSREDAFDWEWLPNGDPDAASDREDE